jgi:Rha family phage regulatory protein
MKLTLPNQTELLSQDVFLYGKEIVTNSLKFAERFNITHMELLRKIKNLTMEYSIVKSEFILHTFINKRNREYPYYKITKNGFMFLVMNAGTPKSEKAKMEYWKTQTEIIKAFNLMENALVNKTNVEWKTAREQGKISRKLETDAIKELLDYIEKTESNSTYLKKPNLCYSNYTKITYKVLGFIQNKIPKTREMLNMLELHQLFLAEDLLSRVIRKGITEEKHYKVIYQDCKIALENYINSLYLN